MPNDPAKDIPTTVSLEKSARLLDGGRLWRAMGYSLTGMRTAYATESAFRQEVVGVALLLPIALFLPVNRYERLALIGSLILVLIVELLNSAVEAVVDRVSFDHHELSGRAKDFGSAAVLLVILLAILTWGVVLYSLLKP